MTGKERKELIVSLSQYHARELKDYVRLRSGDFVAAANISWGVMIGIEASVHAFGLKDMSRDLVALRQMADKEIPRSATEEKG